MTRDEIMQLDDEGLRLAVAKALGYEIVEKRKDGVWLAFHDIAGYNIRGIVGVPDYPRDIAAAYELEDALPEKLRPLYSANLKEVAATASGEIYVNNWLCIHASAADRCRAWLLTMDAKP